MQLIHLPAFRYKVALKTLVEDATSQCSPFLTVRRIRGVYYYKAGHCTQLRNMEIICLLMAFKSMVHGPHVDFSS